MWVKKGNPKKKVRLKKSGGKKKVEVSNRQKWGQTKIFPTENVAKKEWVCRTEFTIILQNFRMWGQKNKIQQNSALQNISCKKCCKWGQAKLDCTGPRVTSMSDTRPPQLTKTLE